MLTGRDACESDRDALATFVCASDRGEAAARDVQEWLASLLEWRVEGATGRVVRLYEDASGLVAVAAWRHLVDGEPGTGFFLYVVAVRLDRRRSGLGRSIMTGLIRHLASREPGQVLAWMVDPANSRSVALSAKLAGDEPLSDPEWPHFLEFTATLPDL